MSHAVVVGAGVFGCWTAHHLSAAGHRVTLIDAHGPANPRSSSGDESRILRRGYGGDEIYSQFADRSLDQWRQLEQRTGAAGRVWHPCGVLWLARDGDAYTQETLATLERGRYPVIVLDRQALRERYPHLVADDIQTALLEPDCGVIAARRAVRLLGGDLVRRGVRLIRGRVTIHQPAGTLRGVRVTVGDSSPQPRLAPDTARASGSDLDSAKSDLTGDLFVFACGAWLPTLFPELLAGRIRPTRQPVVYFGAPAGDDRFSASHTPAWVDFPAGIYGVPDLDDRGVKIGVDAHGAPFDPESGDRTLDDATVVTARNWLRRRFPALADAPIVDSRVCQYENTSTGDFLIDRHPDYDNAWIAGGGSGHGFKHGPAVGEWVARLVATGEPTLARFALMTKGTVARRAIY